MADITPGASGTRRGLIDSSVNFPRTGSGPSGLEKKPRDTLPQSFGDKVPQVAPAENTGPEAELSREIGGIWRAP